MSVLKEKLSIQKSGNNNISFYVLDKPHLSESFKCNIINTSKILPSFDNSSLITPTPQNNKHASKTSISSTILDNPNTHPNNAYADSCCSLGLMVPESKSTVVANLTGIGGTCVNTANGSRICSINTGDFSVGKNITLDAHIFKDEDLTSGSLMGMGALANQNCKVLFDDKTLNVHHDNVSLIQAIKQPHERLYSINLNDLLNSKSENLPVNIANLAIRDTSDMERAKFCSAQMGYPADSTLIKALRNG
jgi:hypothetical protein